jgi:hypothetical protein
LGVLTILHVLLVRAKGVVPPIDAFSQRSNSKVAKK